MQNADSITQTIEQEGNVSNGAMELFEALDSSRQLKKLAG